MARMRRYPLTLLAFSLLAVYAIAASTGIVSSGGATAGKPAIPSAPAGTLFDLVPRIALVYELGGRGSAGFNELAWQGVQRAADVFGAEVKEVTAKPDDTDADREDRLAELAAADYYPIFVIGSNYAGALARVAPKYPDIWFAFVNDGTVDAPNVIGLLFHEEQGSFLVGAAAALTSKRGMVGFIGAAQIPLLQKYEAGFTAGARAANPDIDVQVVYLAQPADDAGLSYAAEARKAALGMYDADVDVIFGVGGDADNGVIQAAHDRGRWAIGANTDQYLVADPSLRDAILTSMLMRADVATYTIAMEIAYSVPKDGNNRFGLDRDAVGYSTSGGFVDPIRAQLDGFSTRIAAGEILVPTKP